MLPDIIRLMSKFTAAEMLRRENFRLRWEAGDAIYLHEFLYALMQGYDAYALACDVQVGGTDQLFNLMAGRKIQEDAGQRPHVPVTVPILVGLDGKERMSKSKGNHIGVDDPPEVQFGKVMSIPDDVMEQYFRLGTNLHPAEIQAIMAAMRSGERTPMETKKLLARTIVAEFWGDEAAERAQEHFERTVQRKEVPDDVPEYRVRDGELLLDVVLGSGVAPSKREARRLFEQRAVTVDGLVMEPTTPARPGSVVQVGKRRWIRLV
jgi:tyrosyl-tRNA synthetase